MKTLTKEQKKQIYDAGRTEADERCLASILNVQEHEVFEILKDSSNEIRATYRKGLYEQRQKTLTALADLAQNGDRLSAAKLNHLQNEYMVRDAIKDSQGLTI